MSQSRDVLELWRRLRQEVLFVNSEREGLTRLHDELKSSHQKLLQQLYLTRRLQSVQNAAESGTKLVECCFAQVRLGQTKFTEMHHNEQEVVGKFFQSLKENPTLVAACLVYGEKMQLESTQGFHNLLETIVLSVYGQSCATQHQTTLLEFIQCLMLHQIGSTERPRQALRKGAFISTYRLLVEALPESRLFLTAALYQPIIQVLLDEGPPLEANPNKLIDTFEPAELQLRFGRVGTAEFEHKLHEYCKSTSRRLQEHVDRFSQSIEQSLPCFPSSIGYIISRAHNIVSDGGMCPPEEARTLACDLLLQDFICLAIVNPERYGVTGDLPIPDKARINLMQIAQQLQRKVMTPDRYQGGFLTRMVEEVLTLDLGDNAQSLKMEFEDRTVICEKSELRRIIFFLRNVLDSGVHGVDAISLSNVISIVANIEQERQVRAKEKSPQSIFFDKLQNSVDKIDRKMKQIQVDGIQAVNKAEFVDIVPPEPVFVIPLPIAQPEFRILSEGEVVVAPTSDIDEAASMDDDGQSRGSKSNYSEVDDHDERLGRGSSSSSVSDHLSSFQGSAGTHVDLDRAQDETDSIAESNPHTNRDEALRALDRNIPSSRESIDDRMRKFELGVRFDIQERDARSDCWSIENAVSEPSEPLTESEYATRLEEIAEEIPSGQLRVQPEDSRSDIWSVEGVPSDNEDDERNSPPAEDNRSRASTPGLSCVSATSSAFSEPNKQNSQESYQEPPLVDIDGARNGNRSPRPSVLLPTKAWQEQQEKLGKSDPKIISPTDFEENDKQFNKISNRRQSAKGAIYKLGSSASKLGSSITKSRTSLPAKYLPSALKKKRNETGKEPGDSPLIQDNPVEDVMAKYQTMTKKEFSAVGQLISIEIAKEEDPKPEGRKNEDQTSRIEDVRRKLRYVLSASDPVDCSPMQPSTRQSSQKDKLLELMRAQSYEALAIQDRTTAAQLQETVRSILPLTQPQTTRVIESLWNEYSRRSTYTRYLIRARQKLLASIAHTKHMSRADSRVRETSRRHFYSVAASIFLKKKHESIRAFLNVYKGPSMQTMDEKADLVEKLLSWLFGEVKQEAEWQNSSDANTLEIQTAVHRNLMTRKDIYHCVLYPNNDIDIQRDKVFSDHISSISSKLTPNHPLLKIPSKYCRECPWPTAQEEAKLISIYRTPKEKMMQTSRLCKAILNLLKLSNPFNVPGADDLVPVLVFVIVKANPPSLLSTIQYVESFIKNSNGEEAFYWMQFTAACKFIQTIEI